MTSETITLPAERLRQIIDACSQPDCDICNALNELLNRRASRPVPLGEAVAPTVEQVARALAGDAADEDYNGRDAQMPDNVPMKRWELYIGPAKRVMALYTAAPQASVRDAVLVEAHHGGDLSALRQANIERQAIWCPDEIPDLSFRGNELGGEVGEALNVIKKLERERLGWRGSRDTVAHLAEELADVVICADLCALSAGVDLASAVIAKFNATSDKVGIPVKLAAIRALSNTGGGK